MTLTIGSLFSGSGMLDEAVRAVFGGDVAWHAEHEPPTEKNPNPTQAAARVLAYRYPGVPNLGDISAVDWSGVPSIDVLTGGFPCQDVSHAGKRAGMSSGTRSGLWARMCDAVETLRPSLVVIENVRGLTSACADSEMGRCPRCVGGSGPHVPVLRALGRVLGDLAEFGYDTQWVGLPACDIGAPHERFRIFITAFDATGARLQGPAFGRVQPGEPLPRRDAAADAADRGHAAERAGGYAAAQSEPPRDPRTPADSERFGRDGWSREQIGGPLGRTTATGTGQDAATDADSDAVRQQPVTERRCRSTTLAGLDREAATDTHDDGRPLVGRELTSQRHTDRRDSQDIAWGEYEPAIRRWEHILGRPAPAPTERGTRGGRRLSRWFDEWMMGWPDGWVTDVPGITYREAIKICGNGVVPQQAEHALRTLIASLEAAA